MQGSPLGFRIVLLDVRTSDVGLFWTPLESASDRCRHRFPVGGARARAAPAARASLYICTHSTTHNTRLRRRAARRHSGRSSGLITYSVPPRMANYTQPPRCSSCAPREGKRPALGASTSLSSPRARRNACGLPLALRTRAPTNDVTARLLETKVEARTQTRALVAGTVARISLQCGPAPFEGNFRICARSGRLQPATWGAQGARGRVPRLDRSAPCVRGAVAVLLVTALLCRLC